MSGAPLFRSPGAYIFPYDLMAYGTLIGICVGSVDSEVAMYADEQVEEDGRIFHHWKI